MSAAQNVGTLAPHVVNAIETEVTSLTVIDGGIGPDEGINIIDGSDVTVGLVTAVSVVEVLITGA